MRVLCVIQGPVFGGAHNQAVRLREPLLAHGIEILALLPDEAQPAAARMREEGLETLTIPLGRLRASPNPRLQARFALGLAPDVRRLRAVISDHDIDVVQVHGATNPHGALAARREPGTGVVWQLFDTRAPMPLRRASMPLVTRLADSMTTWGDALAQMHPGAESLGERRLTVFPPLPAGRFTPDATVRARARERLGIDADQVLVATIGVRNPQKGHEQFVRAAGIVKQRHPEARFRVLGADSPAHEAHMRAVEAEAVGLGLPQPELLDFVDPGSDIPALIQAFDIFVMSSVPRSEGMPTVILEAMAAGKPVVATDVGATSELVEQGVSGIIVEPLNPAAIADPVSELITDPKRRAAIGAAARERAETTFSLDRLAEIHAKAYGIAAERGAARRGRRR